MTVIIQQRSDKRASSEYVSCNFRDEKDEIPENEYKPVCTPLRLAALHMTTHPLTTRVLYLPLLS